MASGPMVYTGSELSSVGRACDLVANPLGKVIQSQEIHIRSTGYPAWGSGNSPKIDWWYKIDKDGVHGNYVVTAADAFEMDIGSYVGMFSMDTGLSAYFTTPGGSTQYDYSGADNQFIAGQSRYTAFFPDKAVQLQIVSETGSPYGILFLAASDKTYCQIDPEGLGLTKAVTVYTLAAGKSFTLKCHYKVLPF